MVVTVKEYLDSHNGKEARIVDCRIKKGIGFRFNHMEASPVFGWFDAEGIGTNITQNISLPGDYNVFVDEGEDISDVIDAAEIMQGPER